MIRIELRDDEELRAQVWIFWLFDDKRALVLDEYREEAKATRRHKWRVTRRYDRQASRVWNREPTEAVEEKDVPLSDDLKARALRELVRVLRVCRWSEAREKGSVENG